MIDPTIAGPVEEVVHACESHAGLYCCRGPTPLWRGDGSRHGLNPPSGIGC